MQSPGQVCGAVRGAELLVEGGEAKGPGGARRTSLCEDPASSCRVGAEEGCHPTFSKAPSSCLVENRLKRDTGGSGETSEEAPRSSRRERWLGWDLQGSPGGVRSGGLLKLL